MKVRIPTSDGAAPGFLARPKGPQRDLPGVLLFPDGLGYRREFEEIAQHVADFGFTVLTPDIFYRSPPYDGPLDFADPRFQARFRETTAQLPPDAMARDGKAYLDFLAAQPRVMRGRMGVVGFCFSGQFALRVAATEAPRVAAAASFHGGRLVTDTPESPHLVIPQVKGALYFGHAENDGSMPMEAIARLDQALRSWGGRWESEVYAGAKHGWMVHGRQVFHPGQAQRGFARLEGLLKAALA